MKGFELVKREDHWGLYNEDGHKIASTLDGCNNKLSIKNCEAIANGYDLDDIVKNHPLEISNYSHSCGLEQGIIYGFQKALEILGDRKFSEKQLKYNMLQLFYLEKNEDEAEAVFKERQLAFIENSIQSLQQTEWEVEIEMEYKQQLANGYKNQYENVVVPKLDAEGNLILKRIEK